MIKYIEITNYLGDTIKMVLNEPEKSGFLISKIEGLDPVKSNINLTDLATNDGSLYNSSKANYRNIVLLVNFVGRRSVEESRHLLYRYFPNKHPIIFKVVTDFREAEIKGFVESNEVDIFSKLEGSKISIVCPYPYFTSTGLTGVKNTIFSGIEPLFEFPFENDSISQNNIEFGLITNKKERSVFYDGDTEVGIIIVINAIGNAKNITIYNSRTREIMKINTAKLKSLTGNEIIAGDEIIINTNIGQKSIILIRKGIQTNILNCLDRNTNWFKLSKGDNIFAYSAEEGNNNLKFRITNGSLYEGI